LKPTQSTFKPQATKYHGTALQVQDEHAFGARDVVMEEVVPARESTPCVDITTQSLRTNQTEFNQHDLHVVHPKVLSWADPAYFETDPAYFETPTKYPDKALQVKDAPAFSAIQRDVVMKVVTANKSMPCVANLTEMVRKKQSELKNQSTKARGAPQNDCQGSRNQERVPLRCSKTSKSLSSDGGERFSELTQICAHELIHKYSC
jgi:hypothetical protein